MSSSPQAGDSDYDPTLSDYEEDAEEFVEIDMVPLDLEYHDMMKESGDSDWEKKVKRMNKLKEKKRRRRKKKKKKRKRKYLSDDDDDYVPKKKKRKKKKKKRKIK